MTAPDPSQATPHLTALADGWTEALTAGPQAQMEWLHRALETAIRLEFSTIPPYLTALWSIKDQTSPVALAIRGVVQEEMLHMALACNMLVAIGGTPPIARRDFAPTYPGPLPGGVHPSLIVGLSGLTRDAVEAFMKIERPEADLTDETAELASAARDPAGGKETGIGAFYQSILTAFHTLSPDLSTERQISGPLSWYAVRTLAEVEDAIGLIQHQGEGSPLDPGEGMDKVTGKQELAHFYRFLEIHSGKAIGPVPGSTGGLWGFTGEPVLWPDVWPVASVPAGGYDCQKAPADVAALLVEFDQAYGLLLQQLHDLWATGDQGLLVAAIGTMFTMQKPACALMQTPIAGADPVQTYAPNFRVPEAAP
jgi:hypothetical protein